MTLVGFLSRDKPRLQHVSDGTFQRLEIRRLAILVLVLIFIAFVDDLCSAVFAAALNNRDTSDKPVHDVLPSVGGVFSELFSLRSVRTAFRPQGDSITAAPGSATSTFPVLGRIQQQQECRASRPWRLCCSAGAHLGRGAEWCGHRTSLIGLH